MVAHLIEDHARRKASERATLPPCIRSLPRVDKPRGGDVAQGFPFWFRSTLHADEPHGGIFPDWITRTTDFLVGRHVSQWTGKSVVRGEPIVAQPSPSAPRKSVRRGDVPTEHWNIQAMLVSLTKELKLLIDLRLSLHRRGSHLDRAVDYILRADAE